jgi:hypothetical protein
MTGGPSFPIDTTIHGQIVRAAHLHMRCAPARLGARLLHFLFLCVSYDSFLIVFLLFSAFFYYIFCKIHKMLTFKNMQIFRKWSNLQIFNSNFLKLKNIQLKIST